MGIKLNPISGKLDMVGSSSGSASMSFATIQTVAGSAPVADSASDTLTLTSTDSTVTVTGTAGTDTVNLQARVATGAVSGIVSTAAQTFAGDKTFSGNIYAANLNSPKKFAVWFDDLMGVVGSHALGWATASNTTGAGASSLPSVGTIVDAAHPGVHILTTGTTTTGAAALRLQTQGIALTGGTWNLQWNAIMEALSTVGEEFIIRMGLGNGTIAEHTNGVYFEYDRLTSTNWQFVTCNNSTRTKADTGVAASAKWTGFRFEVNAAATSIVPYINSVALTAATANIPTSARLMTPLFHIVKSAGTTSRALNLDYFYMDHTWTSARE
jgi:hypothetical protein